MTLFHSQTRRHMIKSVYLHVLLKGLLMNKNGQTCGNSQQIETWDKLFRRRPGGYAGAYDRTLNVDATLYYIEDLTFVLLYY